MTQISQPAVLSYAGPTNQMCPLCHKRTALATKQIYGHPVCKKCFYAFANRRQLGYLVDALIFLVPALAYGYAVGLAVQGAGITNYWAASVVGSIAGIPISCLFLMKDGFRGRSPGRLATDTVVLDETSGVPIRFGQSFKRNLVLMVSQIPIAGGVVSLVVIIVIAVQVARGYRLGDRFARTKVIWKRYANLPMFGGTALVCEQCGYDLRGNASGVCPECGATISELNRTRIASAAVVQS